jgi:hypothetical protein
MGVVNRIEEERRRSPRRPVWSRATVLWVDEGVSCTIRGRVRDVSAEGCSVVSIGAIPAPIGAVAALDLNIMSRFRVTHSRRMGFVHITGLEFLASMPWD